MQISSRHGPGRRSSRPAIAIALALVIVAIGILGCETMPTHIDGRRVVGSRYVDGKRVYLVQDRRGDRTEVIEIAADSARAAKGIVFEGTR